MPTIELTHNNNVFAFEDDGNIVYAETYDTVVYAPLSCIPEPACTELQQNYQLLLATQRSITRIVGLLDDSKLKNAVAG